MRHISRKTAALGFVLAGLLAFTGCAAAEDQSQPDYEDTKKMMVDMLKTDEGKQAIQEVLQDEKVRENFVVDQFFVKDTIEDTLTTAKGKNFWNEMSQDEEFRKTLAESMQERNEQVLKGLMKDPEYQEMLMNVMQDPEMEDEYLELIKSKEYRREVMNIMAEAFESPYFISRLQDIMSKVAEEQLEKQEEEGQNGQQQDEQGEQAAPEEEEGQEMGQGGGSGGN
ncbi:spore germination lipoprotein GerD [Alteribacter natronophilus]|uniref:spore germination lipoprotein GerD n=1 Tax=Alteribacter natronophilus TaxID=2583810 RepID=UPI001486E647|nr:spore germination lipoprotein GerD [Alteribacter natronophilus]